MQVRVRTNFAPSVPYVDRSRAADGVIRRLFEAIAVISKEPSALYGERVRDRVSYELVGYRTILVGRERYGLVFLPSIRHIDDPFAVSGNSNDRP